MKTGIELIAEERKEQIEKHGRTIEADLKFNTSGELLQGALACIQAGANFPKHWDEGICNHILQKTFKDRLVIAGAFIAAEIDRIQANY